VIYVWQRCLQRVNLLKSVAGVSWGAHPSCLILLYRGLIGLVLEYGSVCYTKMSWKHMQGLEMVQYRALGIALRLMHRHIRILEYMTPCCYFLSIGSLFEGEA
jgi:hypothetical protein